MASTRQIKSRIRSVSSNKQITKAMELVAASKLRRAQESTLRTRQYSDMARDILASLNDLTDVKQHELFEKRDVKSRIVIVMTSDRGLAGAFNANVLKQLTKQLREDDTANIDTTVIAVGKKGAQFVSKLRDVEALGVYEAGDTINADTVRPILTTVVDMFRKKEVDRVDVITTRFKNSFTQTIEQFGILPAGFEQGQKAETGGVPAYASFEPSAEEVLDYITVRMIEAQIFQALLDARASEHAMRRVAMKNASDNASDIVEALTLEMNKVRQAAITQELSEISAGVEAMK